MLAMLAHCGGVDYVSEARRLLVRRVACFEAELINLENRFACIRAEGGTPPSKSLDLYQRMAGSQRRCLEALGLNPTMRDVTPDLQSYLHNKYIQADDADFEEADT
jgi:hypothetical protein